MKVVITSTYENIDKKWLNWWLDHLSNEEVMPGCQLVVADIRRSGFGSFTSKDPTSNVTATTTYEVKEIPDGNL